MWSDMSVLCRKVKKIDYCNWVNCQPNGWVNQVLNKFSKQIFMANLGAPNSKWIARDAYIEFSAKQRQPLAQIFTCP